MNTLIISAFPGTGKTYFKNHTDKLVLDSDSSQFSWLESGIRNSDFPQNYIDHIKENIGKVDIILVSSHTSIREALVANNIKFIVVYPNHELKYEYFHRFVQRNNNPDFIKKIINNWDKFINEMENQICYWHIVLNSEEYLSDYSKIFELMDSAYNSNLTT